MPCDYEYILAKLRKVTSPMRACMLSRFIHVQLFVTLWTEAHQVSLPMGFSREEYWNRLPCPTSRDLFDPGIKARSPALQACESPGPNSLDPILKFKIKHGFFWAHSYHLSEVQNV